MKASELREQWEAVNHEVFLIRRHTAEHRYIEFLEKYIEHLADKFGELPEFSPN